VTEDTNKLAVAAQSGDKAAVEQLAASYEAMAYAVADKYGFDCANREDLVQAAMVGLLEAIPSFEPDRASFTTYAYCRMRGAVTQESRRYARMLENATVVDDTGDLVDATEAYVDPYGIDPAELASNKDAVSVAVNALLEGKDNVREAIILYFGLDRGFGRTYAEVGEEMGYTSARIGQLIREGLDLARAAVA